MYSSAKYNDEESVTRNKPILPILLAVFLASALVAAAPAAYAWTRAILYSGPMISRANARSRIPFPSDSGGAVPQGNKALTLYVDFSTIGGTGSTDVTLQACATAFDGSGGGCGQATTALYAAGAVYDIAIGKWLGTGSIFDYFYIDIINSNAGVLWPVGIAIVGN